MLYQKLITKTHTMKFKQIKTVCEEYINSLGYEITALPNNTYNLTKPELNVFINMVIEPKIVLFKYYKDNVHINSFGNMLDNGKTIRYITDNESFQIIQKFIVDIRDLLNIPIPTKVF